jgi:methylglyoxal synthase
MKKIAIIAHDGKKPEMVAFLMKNKEKLKDIDLVATGTTGGYVQNTGLKQMYKCLCVFVMYIIFH